MFTVYSRGLLELNCFTGEIKFSKRQTKADEEFLFEKIIFFRNIYWKKDFLEEYLLEKVFFLVGK